MRRHTPAPSPLWRFGTACAGVWGLSHQRRWDFDPFGQTLSHRIANKRKALSDAWTEAQWHIVCLGCLIMNIDQWSLEVNGRTPAVLLVVEDDKDMRSLLCDELWGEGYQLREASNGIEGVAAVQRAAPDLIVTDLKMPSGGFDYVHRLRNCAPGCPIIVMTAFGDARTKEQALKSGATAYFDKPVRLAELKATVKRLLHRSDSLPDERSFR